MLRTNRLADADNEDFDLATLQEKVGRWTRYWRLIMTCGQATILGGIALIEHRPFVFALAFIPFPMIFMVQIYEQRLEKALFRQIKNAARQEHQNFLDKMQKKSAP